MKKLVFLFALMLGVLSCGHQTKQVDTVQVDSVQTDSVQTDTIQIDSVQ